MKLASILSTSLLAVIAAFSIGAQAASDTDKAAEARAAPMKMMPHSHVEEKTGVPQKAPAATPEKANAAKDKSKHYHPRDNK